MTVYTRKKSTKKGSKTYHWFQFQFRGKTYTGSARTRIETRQAEANARAKAERGLGAFNAQPTVKDFIDGEYESYAKQHKQAWERDLAVAQKFADFCESMRLGEVTRKTVREFLTHRAEVKTKHGKARSNGTLNREKSVISSILTLAVEEEWIAENPVLRVKSRKAAPPRLLYWTEADESKVMPYFVNEREHLRSMVIVALYTGLRRGEFLSARVGQVDFENNLLAVFASKTNSRRHVALEPNVRDVLFELCRGKGSNDYIFINGLTGRPYCDPKTGIRFACEKAGVPYIGWHGLRHTRGTRLALRGWNAFAIAAELGHSDIRTSQRYVHLAEAAQRAATVTKLFEVPGDAGKSEESLGKVLEKERLVKATSL